MVQYKYDAWGNVITEVIDEAHAGIAELNPFRYRSYYYDTETNLYYLNTRYYDPEVGRFISQDDVSYLDPEHINGLNLFAYCGNNPVMNVDPSGRSLTAFIVLLIVGVVIGTVSGSVFGGLSEVATSGNFMDGFWGGLANGFISTVGLALGIAASIFLTPAAGIAIAGFFGAVGGLVGGMITEGIKNDWDANRFDWGGIMLSAVTGAVSNVLSCAIGGYLIKDAGIVFKSFLDAFVKNLAISSFTYVSWVMIGWPVFAISLIPLVLLKKKEEEKQKQYATA